MLSSELQAEIEKAVGAQITSVAPLSAANNSFIYRLHLSSGRSLVAKMSNHGVEVEAFMLKYLKEKSKLPVPAVYYTNERVVIMDFIQADWHLDAASQGDAAKLLAELHTIKADLYGFERDTQISSLRQPNTQTKDWVEFFRTQRLMFMAQEALREGKIDSKLMKKIEKLAAKLGEHIKTPNPPALIHGDLWGGNILAGKGKIAAFLDPAIYFADPEIELAAAGLFDTFGDSFFAKYQQVHKIADGFFETRKDIYNLYPLLVHTRLFGPSYARKVQKIVERFVG